MNRSSTSLNSISQLLCRRIISLAFPTSFLLLDTSFNRNSGDFFTSFSALSMRKSMTHSPYVTGDTIFDLWAKVDSPGFLQCQISLSSSLMILMLWLFGGGFLICLLIDLCIYFLIYLCAKKLFSFILMWKYPKMLHIHKVNFQSNVKTVLNWSVLIGFLIFKAHRGQGFYFLMDILKCTFYFEKCLFY